MSLPISLVSGCLPLAVAFWGLGTTMLSEVTRHSCFLEATLLSSFGIVAMLTLSFLSVTSIVSWRADCGDGSSKH